MIRVFYSSRITLPAPTPVEAPAEGGPVAELPPRAPADPTFDPATGLSLDGTTVYVTCRVGPEAYDGSMQAPGSIIVKMFDTAAGAQLAEGRRDVHGPGPIAVPIEGLTPGTEVDIELSAYYVD